MSSSDALEISPRNMAIQFLARREYSYAELMHRLTQKGVTEADAQHALNELAHEGLQSDQRFAEVFLRSRIALGHGPLRVKADLAQRGVGSTLLSQALESEAVDWDQLACQALAKRFADSGANPRERAKRERFLAQRGFEFDQVRYALRHAWEDVD